MKRTITILAIFVVAAIFCVCGIKYAAERSEENLKTFLNSTTAETTTEVEETTAELETTTEAEETTTKVDIKPETTKRYENPLYFKEVGLISSELPFNFGYPNAVGKVNMYVPTEERGDSDVWDNTYIVVEHHRNSEVILKLDKADGIITGNIVPMEEMINGNLTFIYFDGEYSQDYKMDRDGDMIILKDFPEGIEEIRISNRSTNPIYEGVISGEKVYVNDIIIKVVD